MFELFKTGYRHDQLVLKYISIVPILTDLAPTYLVYSFYLPSVGWPLFISAGPSALHGCLNNPSQLNWPEPRRHKSSPGDHIYVVQHIIYPRR